MPGFDSEDLAAGETTPPVTGARGVSRWHAVPSGSSWICGAAAPARPLHHGRRMKTNLLLVASVTLALAGCNKDTASATAVPGEADASAQGDDVSAGAASDDDTASAVATEEDAAATATVEGEGAEAEAAASDDADE